MEIFFESLTVLKESDVQSGKNKRWDCSCVCGNIVSVRVDYFKYKKHCGCKFKTNAQRQKTNKNKEELLLLKNKKEKEQLKKAILKTYQKDITRLKGIHRGAKERCYNPSSKSYKDYGAKGKTLSPSWLESVDNFIEDMLPSYLEFEKWFGKGKATLDRIDNSLGYSKENCRWATREQQAQHRDFLNPVTVYGVDYPSISALSRDYEGLAVMTLMRRYNAGWVNEELVLPLGTKIKEYRQNKNSNV